MPLAGRLVGPALGPPRLGPALPPVLRLLAALPAPPASAAFGRPLRAVVAWRGPLVPLLARCSLPAALPVQLLWGTPAVVLPVRPAP
ncbi:hypothetical protein C3R44_23400, partial [Mycobacterium tuberculosis]